MRTKKGRTLHLKGRVLPISENDASATMAHAGELFRAIRREATQRRGSVKLFMNWTGASERSAKAWLGGSSLPRADHLIALMASSDEIFEAVLRMTGRETAMAAQDLAAARSHLAQATAIVERLVTGGSSPQNERKG